MHDVIREVASPPSLFLLGATLSENLALINYPNENTNIILQAVNTVYSNGAETWTFLNISFYRNCHNRLQFPFSFKENS
jgi:hypothetical protein